MIDKIESTSNEANRVNLINECAHAETHLINAKMENAEDIISCATSVRYIKKYKHK